MEVLRPGMFDLAADDMEVFVTTELAAYLERIAAEARVTAAI